MSGPTICAYSAQKTAFPSSEATFYRSPFLLLAFGPFPFPETVFTRKLRQVVPLVICVLAPLCFAVQAGVDTVLSSKHPGMASGELFEQLHEDDIKWLRVRTSWSESPKDTGADGDLRSAWTKARKNGFGILAYIRGVRRSDRQEATDLPSPSSQLPADLRVDLLTVYRRAAWMAYTHVDAVDAWELLNEGEYHIVKDMPDRATAWEKAVWLGLKAGAARASSQKAVGSGKEVGGRLALRSSENRLGGGARGAPKIGDGRSEMGDGSWEAPSAFISGSETFSDFIPGPFRPEMRSAVPVLRGAIGGLPDTAYYRVKARNGFLDYGDAHNFHFYGWIESLDDAIEAHKRFIASWEMGDGRWEMGKQGSEVGDRRSEGGGQGTEVGSGARGTAPAAQTLTPHGARGTARPTTANGGVIRSQLSVSRVSTFAPQADLPSPISNLQPKGAPRLWLTEINTYRGELAGREERAWAEQAAYLSRAVELADAGGVEVIMPFILYREGFREGFNLFSKDLQPLPPWEAYAQSLRDVSKSGGKRQEAGGGRGAPEMRDRRWEIGEGREVKRSGSRGSVDGSAGTRGSSLRTLPAGKPALPGEPAQSSPFANCHLPTANSRSPSAIVLQWIVDPETADSNKFNGSYRFQPANDPARGWQAIEGTLRVYNFGPETVEGVLGWETTGAVEAVVWEIGGRGSGVGGRGTEDGGRRTEDGSLFPELPSAICNLQSRERTLTLPSMAMQSFRLRLIAKPEVSGQFFRGAFSAEFDGKTEIGDGSSKMGEASAEVIPREGATAHSPFSNHGARGTSRLRRSDQSPVSSSQSSVSFDHRFNPPTPQHPTTPPPPPSRNPAPPPISNLPSPISKLFFPLEARPDWAQFEAMPVELATHAEGALRRTSRQSAVGSWQNESLTSEPESDPLSLYSVPSVLKKQRPAGTASPTPKPQHPVTPPLPRWVERDFDPELALFEELVEQGDRRSEIGDRDQTNPHASRLSSSSSSRPLYVNQRKNEHQRSSAFISGLTTSTQLQTPNSQLPADRWQLAPIGVTASGRLDWHNRDYPFGYEWTSQSGVWSGMNGLQVEVRGVQGGKFPTLRMELPIEFPHSQKRPIAAARIVGGLPRDGWLALTSGRRFSPTFNLQVYLIDRWGQRWWIDEQLVSNPHLQGNTKFLPLRDFDPTYFGNVIPGNPFRPEDIVELQLELIGGAGKPPVEVVIGVLKAESQRQEAGG